MVDDELDYSSGYWCPRTLKRKKKLKVRTNIGLKRLKERLEVACCYA